MNAKISIGTLLTHGHYVRGGLERLVEMRTLDKLTADQLLYVLPPSTLRDRQVHIHPLILC